MSCVHDGGFGSSIACAKCNSDLAVLLDAPECGAFVGVMGGAVLWCNQRAGHYSEHSHTMRATLHCNGVQFQLHCNGVQFQGTIRSSEPDPKG